ncbi:MAG: alpha/beta hydrolase [Burkholderiaceae bacterium]|nr:alpha/beta hydrolase [Burkholderiaceae bacterium]
MERRNFIHDGLTLSYLDQGGAGVPIIALHAYWMEAGTYADLAEALAPEWRVVALDQRGHGHSDHAKDMSWDAFIGDLAAFLDHLGVDKPAILLGNSLGGTVAFRYAARNLEKVRVMVIEESPAEEDSDLGFMRAWAGTYQSREALAAKIGERLAWSVEPSFRQTPEGWILAFSPNALADAQAGLNGNFWDDWMATDCPVLVVRGTDSRAVDGAILESMATRRPNTRLVSFAAGHVVHHDEPEAFATAVRAFLVGEAPFIFQDGMTIKSTHRQR